MNAVAANLRSVAKMEWDISGHRRLAEMLLAAAEEIERLEAAINAEKNRVRVLTS